MQRTDAQELMDWYLAKYGKTAAGDFLNPNTLFTALSFRLLGLAECENRRNMILVSLFRRLDSTHRLKLVEHWWLNCRVALEDHRE